MILSGLRKPVDTFVPSLGRLYRLTRDVTNGRRPMPTKFGFSLAGCPPMAKDGWEVDEIEAFIELMATHDAVVDIGANVGFYSCLAASQGKHTIAFEPSSRNLNFLYKNLWDNQFLDVEVLPLGLARQSGLGRIYGFSDMASLVPGWAQARNEEFSLIPLTTLDLMLAGRFRNQKLFIKMDVEGYESEVLAGASKTMDLDPKPTWMVEILLSGETIPGGISQKFSETFDVFWGHGYQCRMLNAERTPVERADVSRWVSDGRVESGAKDFLFSAM